MMLDTYSFCARAGEAETADTFKYIEKETLEDKANNLIRGSFGPYIAFNQNLGQH
jgi:hypothetical protein